MNHPYRESEDTVLWREIDAIITALERNGDLQLTTAREYVIGSICKRLSDADVLSKRPQPEE
jgi:hypothetical protein